MLHTVLVVDDSEWDRDLTARVLRRGGYDVIEAAHGGEALESLRRDLSSRVHMVITDLHVSGLNGVDLVRALRVDPAYRTVPVAILTSETSGTWRQECMVSGASLWLSKPCAPSHLLREVGKQLRVVDGREWTTRRLRGGSVGKEIHAGSGSDRRDS